MPRIPSKGETVKLICERCYQLFSYTGNGDGTIPTTCPNCKHDSALPRRAGQAGWDWVEVRREMADKLFKLEPQDGMWPGHSFWFTTKGDLLWGKNPDNLIYPYQLATYGKLHIYLEDLRGAFKLGRESALQDVAKFVSQNFEGTPAEIYASLKAADIDVTIAQVALWRKEAQP